MKILSFIFIFILPYHIVESSIIQGTFPGYAGETVNIFLFEDYFVYKQQLIQAVSIDQKGTFDTELNFSYPQLVNVTINNISKRFYVVPEQNYAIHINKKEIFVEEEKSPGLNHFIETIENDYEKLARKSFSFLILKGRL